MNMLVVTRRIGEVLVIGGDVRVAVVAIDGDRVQLGTSAPPSATVDRSEVHERRSEFADRRQRSPSLAAAPLDSFVESLASDLAEVAYRVALRHGSGDQWLQLQLDLWWALTEALEKRTCSDHEILLPCDPPLDVH
jgi:carbon storage regulator